MKKDAVKTRNQIANQFYDLADTAGISKAVRDRLRKIGDEITNYRLNEISAAAASDLGWLGENIRDFIDPENLRIMDNFTAEVRKALSQQDKKQEGGKIMGFLDKLRGKSQKTETDNKETEKAKKNIFIARQLIEKNLTVMEEEKKKIADIIGQASKEPKDSPRYQLLQGEWQLSRDRIKSCGTKMTLAFNTLKVNSKMVDAVDILETTKLLERMMPDSKKAEKLMDKAMEKTEDLVDMQDEMTALLEDALAEMDSTVSVPVSDKAFANEIDQHAPAVPSEQRSVSKASSDPDHTQSDTEKASSADKTVSVTEEEIDSFLAGAA